MTNSLTDADYIDLRARVRRNMGLEPQEQSAPTETRSEAQIEAECTRLLQEDGWRALRTDPVSDRGRGKGFGEIGIADHLYIRYRDGIACAMTLSGREMTPTESDSLAQVLWIEFKRPKAKAAKHQTAWHQRERARGALTLIAGEDFPASVDGFKAWYEASGLMRRPRWW